MENMVKSFAEVEAALGKSVVILDCLLMI